MTLGQSQPGASSQHGITADPLRSIARATVALFHSLGTWGPLSDAELAQVNDWVDTLERIPRAARSPAYWRVRVLLTVLRTTRHVTPKGTALADALGRMLDALDAEAPKG